MTKLKKHQRRLIMILCVGLALACATAIALYALRDSVSYFYSPTMIVETPPALNRPFRLGGIVAEGSLIENVDTEHYEFSLEDGAHQVRVHYDGPLPSLFREGQGIIALGTLSDQNIFVASRILAKHDENYMPPEIKKTIQMPKAYE